MGFNCGIIGLPNCGKSTIFNALTSAGATASSFAFSTVEPNVARVTVPDERLDRIVEIVKPKKTIYTQMEFVDIPGLSEGASRGEGMGNRFLSHVRSVDAIVYVVRCFESKEMVAAETLDPLRDIGIVESELMLADLESVEKKMQTIKKSAKKAKMEKGKPEDALVFMERLEKIADGLQREIPASKTGGWDIVKELPLLTTKPVMFVANLGDPSQENGSMVKAIRDYAQQHGAACVAVCGQLEAEISELEPEERQTFMEEMGLKQSGLHTLIQEGYKLLGLVTFLTAGPKEARAWTIRKGMSAPEAAGKIHTDFVKGFIRAEVITFDDYMECGGENGAKDKGKMRLEGKEYIVKDGDVILFRVAT